MSEIEVHVTFASTEPNETLKITAGQKAQLCAGDRFQSLEAHTQIVVDFVKRWDAEGADILDSIR